MRPLRVACDTQPTVQRNRKSTSRHGTTHVPAASLLVSLPVSLHPRRAGPCAFPVRGDPLWTSVCQCSLRPCGVPPDDPCWPGCLADSTRKQILAVPGGDTGSVEAWISRDWLIGCSDLVDARRYYWPLVLSTTKVLHCMTEC